MRAYSYQFNGHIFNMKPVHIVFMPNTQTALPERKENRKYMTYLYRTYQDGFKTVNGSGDWLCRTERKVEIV